MSQRSIVKEITLKILNKHIDDTIDTLSILSKSPSAKINFPCSCEEYNQIIDELKCIQEELRTRK